jgi:hypothetical protein
MEKIGLKMEKNGERWRTGERVGENFLLKPLNFLPRKDFKAMVWGLFSFESVGKIEEELRVRRRRKKSERDLPT